MCRVHTQNAPKHAPSQLHSDGENKVKSVENTLTEEHAFIYMYHDSPALIKGIHFICPCVFGEFLDLTKIKKPNRTQNDALNYKANTLMGILRHKQLRMVITLTSQTEK